MTTTEAAAILGERCPRCGGPMELTVIDGHDSWACPVDAYAYAVDQDAAEDCYGDD